MSDQGEGLRGRLASKSEDAIGKLAQDLLENPLINGALTRALGARERAAQAQEVAMGALNIPSASDVERLTRRVRSVSQRLEAIEDLLDRVEQGVTRLAGAAGAQQLSAIEAQLASLSKQVGDLHAATPQAANQIPRDQERLRVEDPAPAAPGAAATKPVAKRTPARAGGSGTGAGGARAAKRPRPATPKR